MVSPAAKLIGLRTQYEQILHNALLVTEMATELKERAQAGEKYICQLRSLAVKAARVISAMHSSGKTFIILGHRLASSALKNLEAVPVTQDGNSQLLKQEYERLLAILEKELLDMEDVESVDMGFATDMSSVTPAGIAERLKHLESKQRYSELSNLPATYSARNFRPEVDDKYPGNWSRESLIDLNNVINLPSVPEDIFTSFSKPTRTSSLSSLRSIRKVKLYLQRAANSEDEESEYDDHELSMSVSRACAYTKSILILLWHTKREYQIKNFNFLIESISTKRQFAIEIWTNQ